MRVLIKEEKASVRESFLVMTVLNTSLWLLILWGWHWVFTH